MPKHHSNTNVERIKSALNIQFIKIKLLTNYECRIMFSFNEHIAYSRLKWNRNNIDTKCTNKIERIMQRIFNCMCAFASFFFLFHSEIGAAMRQFTEIAKQQLHSIVFKIIHTRDDFVILLMFNTILLVWLFLHCHTFSE